MAKKGPYTISQPNLTTRCVGTLYGKISRAAIDYSVNVRKWATEGRPYDSLEDCTEVQLKARKRKDGTLYWYVWISSNLNCPIETSEHAMARSDHRFRRRSYYEMPQDDQRMKEEIGITFTAKDMERLVEPLQPELDALSNSTQDKYGGRYLRGEWCHDHRMSGSIAPTNKILTPEGLALRLKAEEFVGDRIVSMGFKTGGMLWLRFASGPWLLPRKGKRPRKERPGIDVQSLHIFKDQLLDEGIDAWIEEDRYRADSADVWEGDRVVKGGKRATVRLCVKG